MLRKNAKDQVLEQRREETTEITTRRAFVRNGVAALSGMAAITAALPASSAAEQKVGEGAGLSRSLGQRTAEKSTALDLLRVPDLVTAYGGFEKTLPAGLISLDRKGEQWRGGKVVVESRVGPDGLVLTLEALATPIAAVHVRWRADVAEQIMVLGDAWERSYGELGWRKVISERAMPWYFATYVGRTCDGYGVKTDARALCLWQLDPEGVSLWLNVTNGGNGVDLGKRRLTMATVVARHGAEGEEAIDAVAGLCRAMCARSSRKVAPIYGANDWCYSYGRSTAETILRDTEFIAELSPTGGVRPFSVIDGGWDNGTAAWPDMAKLASGIKQRTARPGIWIRPLEAPRDTEHALLLPDGRFGAQKGRAKDLAYDPTVPEARDLILEQVRKVTGWGYEMVKHDFSTYDLLEQWGFEMGPQPTLPGWSLHDRSKTNAEVIVELYSLLRQGAGEQVLLDGCNTVGHLGQGVFDLQRTGDDTSGQQWERTRRMGVNTASFRLPQHGTFFTLDADLVGITDAVPWELNRQWLDLLARSGTTTMISPGPPARGREQRAAIREAFKTATAGGVGAKPVDWMELSAPELWRSGSQTGSEAERRYHWDGSAGASPFVTW